MHAERFDSLTRALIGSGSRRDLLAALGLLPAAAACKPLAKPCAADGQCCSGVCHKQGKCKKKGKLTGKCRCACPAGTTPCPDGSCGQCCTTPADCGADSACRTWACGSDNRCVPTDAGDTTQCGAQDGCDGDTFQPPGFCDGKGACDQLGPEVCTDDGNPCTLNFCDSQAGCGAIDQVDNAPCGDGRICCNGACRGSSDFQSDPANCGACGNQCPPEAGHCCSGGCTNLQDRHNCGVCGNGCGFLQCCDDFGPFIGHSCGPCL